jgi:hypothetical protein
MNVWLHKQVMTRLAEGGGKVPDSMKHAWSVVASRSNGYRDGHSSRQFHRSRYRSSRPAMANITRTITMMSNTSASISAEL